MAISIQRETIQASLTQWLSCGVKVVPKNGTIKQIKMLCSLFGTVRLSIFIPLINIYKPLQSI